MNEGCEVVIATVPDPVVESATKVIRKSYKCTAHIASVFTYTVKKKLPDGA